MKDTREHFNRLIEVLQLVAANNADQRAALPDFVHVPDEVALMLDEMMPFIDEFVATGMLDAKQATSIQKMDAAFALKSERDNPSFWTLDAMRNDGEWETIRALARKALHALHQPLRSPNLYWLQYVRSR